VSLGANTHIFPNNASLRFFSGFGGRVAAVQYNGPPTVLDTPPAGIAGAVLLWVKTWSCEISAEVFGADTFENPLNSRGKPFKRKDLVGLASGKVDLDGYSVRGVGGFNLINVGSIFGLELNMGNVAPGQSRKIYVYGLCSSVSRAAAADGNSPIEFKCSFEFASPPAFVVS